MEEDFEEALEIIQEALKELEETWGREAYEKGSWGDRAAALLAKRGKLH